jgi:hypothetical protein
MTPLVYDLTGALNVTVENRSYPKSGKGKPNNSAVVNPTANPSMIGNGKPGNIPFFSNAKKVMMDPAKIPTTAVTVGRTLDGKLKYITPINIE